MVALYNDPEGKNVFKEARRSVVGIPVNVFRNRIININSVDSADKDISVGVQL